MLPVLSQAQIDPERRHLIQIGYNQPLEGRGPLSAYAFYYRNEPDFPATNLTFRLALAPVYLDTELGFRGLLSERTDFAIGMAGGGFADSYYEVRRGKLIDAESFTGHGGEVSASVYHRFNPQHRIPLSAIWRASARYSVYERDSRTDPDFRLPEDKGVLAMRAGLRWGGSEPFLFPVLGMELSTWYEGQARSGGGSYGFTDREVERWSHLFWARGLIIYTLPEWRHRISFNLTAGTSIDADRFSAYRLGGVLPMAAEFPLMLPGYYFEEISARRFLLFGGRYTMPLNGSERWNLTALGAIAKVDYPRGMQQPGKVHSGVGMGIGYRSRSEFWQVVVGYSYGINAVRNGAHGAHSIGILAEFDLDARHRRVDDPYFDIESPYKSRGLFRLLFE